MERKIKKLEIVSLIISVFTLLILLFQLFYGKYIENSNIVANNFQGTFNVNGIEYSVENSNINVSSLNIFYPISIDFSKFNDYKISVNGIEIDNYKDYQFKIDNISRDAKIELSFKKDGNENIVYINTLPDDFPKFRTVGSSSTDGYFYLGYSNYIMKLNSNGEVVYYKKATENTDFRRWEIDGKVYYSYIQINPSPSEAMIKNDVGQGLRQVVIMNEFYQEIDWLTTLYQTEKIPENVPLENHDFYMLDLGHYIISSYYGERVYNIPEYLGSSSLGARVIASVIQEVKDGKVIFEWKSTDYPQLYEYSVESNDFDNENVLWSDYAHFNSIDIDPKDSNFIMSFRHLDTIIKVNRKTGDMMWILGGIGDQFGLKDEQKFSKQHHATFLENGNILLFDNGNNEQVMYAEDTSKINGVGYSRAIEIQIDEKNKKILDYKEYVYDGRVSKIMGSAQKLTDDILLLGWGGMFNNGVIFSEIDFKNHKVLFEVIDSSVEIGTYRVYYSQN